MTEKRPARKGTVPPWVGRHPYPPEDKRPVVVGREDAVLFTFGHRQQRVSCTTHISTDLVQAGIMIVPPGGTFDPPDIHAGDEVYYIRTGEIAVFDPATGDVVRARAGEVIWIPKGVWHQSFNTGADVLEVYAFIAPLQWKAGESAVPEHFDERARCLTPSHPSIDPMGGWPDERGAHRPSVQRSGYADALGVVCGSENRLPTFLHISNANIHVGEFSLPSGFSSDADRHAGDEVLFVIEGNLAVHTRQEAEATGPIKYVLEAAQGQAMLIPQGWTHEYVNMTAAPVRVVFAVAPEM
jgi:mannose-6-phosphate isomerase-like protein (cupin superfamily)